MSEETMEYSVEKVNRQAELKLQLLAKISENLMADNNSNKVFRTIFVMVSLALLGFIIIGFSVTCIILALREPGSTTIITIVAGAGSTLMTAIVFIPKIIVMSVFSPERERNMVSILHRLIDESRLDAISKSE